MELNVSVHSVFSFTLLFEYVLQGMWLSCAVGTKVALPSRVAMFDMARCRFMAVVKAWGLGWCLGHV